MQAIFGDKHYDSAPPARRHNNKHTPKSGPVNDMPTPAASLAALLAARPGAHDRPADWRWKLAGLVVHNRMRLAPETDLRLVQVVFFLQELARCQSNTERQRVEEAFPALSQAYGLWHSGPLLARLEVESRILAREPIQTIARKTQLPPATVSAYEQCFFNVLDRIDSPGWITHQIIGPGIHSALDPCDVRTFWFLYAYHGGVFLLERLIDDLLQNGGKNYKHVLRTRLRGSKLPVEKLMMYRALKLRMLKLDNPKSKIGLCLLYFADQFRQSRPPTADCPKVAFDNNLDTFDELLDELQPAEAA